MIMTASEVLDRFWDGSLPIDPIAIASKMGVRVITEIGDESGYSQFDNNNVPTLSYNPLESSFRQRFTIAHELGHIVLGHVTGNAKVYRNGSKEHSNPVWETAANKFAANLLMPQYAIEKLIAKGITDPDDLARYFAVSQEAMRYRINSIYSDYAY